MERGDKNLQISRFLNADDAYSLLTRMVHEIFHPLPYFGTLRRSLERKLCELIKFICRFDEFSRLNNLGIKDGFKLDGFLLKGLALSAEENIKSAKDQKHHDQKNRYDVRPQPQGAQNQVFTVSSSRSGRDEINRFFRKGKISQ